MANDPNAGPSTTSRPMVQDIKNAYNHLFCSGPPISKIKDLALRGRLFNEKTDTYPTDEDDSEKTKGAGVVGRSMAWKVFLVQTEPLQSQTADIVASPPLDTLRRSRQEYQRLLLERMRAPDGSYQEGFIIPGTGTSPARNKRADNNLDMNNPLSLHDENPWTAWFTSMDLRKEILQDVERTFPDIGYFRDPHVQAELTDVLFLYSVTHPDIGYRQGMHELLAPLYYAVDYDSVLAPSPAPPEEEFCSRSWVAADAWTLFSSIMRGVGRWFEWREPRAGRGSNIIVTTPTSTPEYGKNPLASHVHLNLTNSDAHLSAGMQPYVAPIVDTCNKIQSALLKSVDPLLWKSLQASGIEPQMYGIRWLRLLFTREFAMEDAMTLWDGLFACDPSFELVPWICVAMLIRIRNNLIPADYSTQLTHLLRYPSSVTSLSSSTPSIHPCILLLRQALTLQMSPTTATGASIVQENSNLLNIPTEVPDAPPPTMRRRPGNRNQSYSASEAETSSRGTASSGAHFRQGSASMGLPEMIARGLLERGESLGINKTVMNAVSELKRNLPDLATTLQRLPTPMTTQESSYAAYPLIDEKPPTERPPWEPRTRFEIEKGVAQLQSLQRQLGDSVAWIVDTLLLDDGTLLDDNGERMKLVKERKREAIESLAYVRDVLKGIVPPEQVEKDRLLPENELKKRREQSKKDTEAAGTSGSVRQTNELSPAEQVRATLTPPKPVAKTLPQLPARSSASQGRSQDYFSIGTSLPRSPPQAGLIAKQPAQHVKQISAPPTPSMGNVLTPNKSAMPLAPWNHTPSSFAPAGSPTAVLHRLPSRPSAVASPRQPNTLRMNSPYHATSQTPTGGDQPPPAMATNSQDPLGVLR